MDRQLCKLFYFIGHRVIDASKMERASNTKQLQQFCSCKIYIFASTIRRVFNCAMAMPMRYVGACEWMSLQSYEQSSNHQMWTKLNGHTYEAGLCTVCVSECVSYRTVHSRGHKVVEWAYRAKPVVLSCYYCFCNSSTSSCFFFCTALDAECCWSCAIALTAPHYHQCDKANRRHGCTHTLCVICSVLWQLCTYIMLSWSERSKLEQSVMRQRHK